MDHTQKEVTEIQLHPKIFNRNGSFMLTQTWQPVLKEFWDSSTENPGCPLNPLACDLL
jgi:hypothetical protein